MTLRSARLVLAGAFAAVLVGLALGSAGCHRRSTPAASSDELRIPDQEARDFTLTESDAGVKNWTLRAVYAAMFNREHRVDAKTVTIDFFDKEGALYSTLTADRGEIDQTTNDLEARGNVHVTTKNGVAMETDSLRFFNRTGKIVSDGFVRVTRQGDVLTGIGFESDATLEHFRLRREVRAEVKSAGGASAFGP
ncbi:MAG TPA: LPS export ABC transporter periplasmic protein LptC [Thermoanaerobaculia bacterium]|nr:LPS export ABC transporter periplasmic protein LptC [Thermoanaerobaculia bacterium]